MNYLGRQIFPFAINWAEAVQRNVTYNLREMAVGFGAEYFTPTATYTNTAWDFSLYHGSGPDLLAFEAFCDSLVGRLVGFWLPCPLNAAVISAGISTTQFKILNEGLAGTWNSRPDQHLFFVFADGTQAAGKIQGVVDNGDGTETVTMTAALSEAPGIGTNVQRLHYVRFAQDVEELDFDAEGISQGGVASMQLTVVELPLEYTAVATGLQPLYLYHFWMKAPVNVDWYYTSFASPVVSNGVLFNFWPMSHNAIKKTTDGNSNPMDITAKPDESHPFSMMSGMPPGKVLWCEIKLAYIATPDVTQTIFHGFIKNVDDDGPDFVAHAADRLDWLKTKAPNFYIGSNCNYDLYDPATCKVAPAPFETTVTIATVFSANPPVIYCTFNFAFQLANWQRPDWFKGGQLETGLGTQYDIRTIFHSVWNPANSRLQLTLNAPLRSFNGVGAKLQIRAGCDHTSDGPDGCKLKFNNFARFGGHIAVPDQNLSLKGLNTSVSQGNKKS